MQTNQINILEYHYPNLVSTTVQLKRDLRLIVSEKSNFSQPKSKKAPRKVDFERQTILHVYKDVNYYGLIDEEKKTVMIFVPRKGWFESAILPLEEVAYRDDRTEESVNYRKWGNSKTMTTHMEVV